MPYSADPFTVIDEGKGKGRPFGETACRPEPGAQHVFGSMVFLLASTSSIKLEASSFQAIEGSTSCDLRPGRLLKGDVDMPNRTQQLPIGHVSHVGNI